MKKHLFAGLFIIGSLISSSVSASNSLVSEQNSMQEINQGRKIAGTVTDSRGEALIGVTVTIKNTSTGTITDIDGKFSLDVSEQAETLVFSYVGYKSVEIKANAGSPLKVVLEEDNKLLQEVVVVGYGTQKKATITGAVDAVSADEINLSFNSNMQNLLTGKLTGVRIMQNTSEPGAFNSSINIRGMGKPLIVIDGMISDMNVFNRMSPSEIESVSVLKDAAAAVYGMKAGNGVLLVTTRKGSEKGTKPTIEYSANLGLSRLINLNKPMNAYEYAVMRNEVNKYKLYPEDPMYTEEQLEQIRNTPGLDVYDAVMRKSNPSVNHTVNVSGNAGEKYNVKYFISANYLKEYGLYRSGDLSYDRYNLRSNLSTDLGYGLSVGLNLSYMQDKKDSPYDGEVFKDIWGARPVDEKGNVLTSLYADEEKGYFLKFPKSSGNPLASTQKDAVGYVMGENKNLTGHLNLMWDIPFVTGLKTQFQYSFENRQYTSKRWAKQYSLYDTDSSGNLVEHQANKRTNLKQEYNEYLRNNIQAMISYDKTIANSHNFKILGVFEQLTLSQPAGFSAMRLYYMDSVEELFGGSTTPKDQQITGGKPEKIVNQGFIGRLNYDFEGKYLLEGSFRYDGSSAFAEGHQWGFFTGLSAGWRLSEESFIKKDANLSFIDNIKIRGSYGRIGNDDGAEFAWISGYEYPEGSYIMGGEIIPGLQNTGLENKDLTWFTYDTYNVGLDFDFWKGMLSGTVDLYRRDGSGLFASKTGTIPQTVGITMPMERLNSDMTIGWELLLSHTNKINGLTYNVSGNLNIFRTKWKHYEQERAVNSYENWKNNKNDRWNDITWGHVTGGQILTEEQAKYLLNHQKTSQMALAGPGDYWHLDLNGDGWIDEWGDLAPRYTNNVPKVVYGFTIGAEYKGIDLNMVFNGAAKYTVTYEEFLRNPLVYDGLTAALQMWTDRWHQDDAGNWIEGKYPRYRGEWTYLPNVWDDGRRIKNASYLRLKNIEIGYTLPKTLLEKLHLQKVRFYANAYNLLTFSGIKEMDPEAPSQYKYPMAKNYNFGLNVTF